MNIKTLALLSILLACVSAPVLSEPIWLDVRSTSEFNTGHIEGAIHLPHSQVNQSATKLLPNKDSEILIYCRSGGRAEKAKNALKTLGYTNIRNIGGLDDAEEMVLELKAQ